MQIQPLLMLRSYFNYNFAENVVVSFVVNTERLDDGALLGYISLGLRSSTDEPL
jgi:hypothetical protein